MDEDKEIQNLREKFKFVCLKCGSDDVTVNMENGHSFASRYQSGNFQIGCNACKENDWYLWF